MRKICGGPVQLVSSTEIRPSALKGIRSIAFKLKTPSLASKDQPQLDRAHLPIYRGLCIPPFSARLLNGHHSGLSPKLVGTRTEDHLKSRVYNTVTSH